MRLSWLVHPRNLLAYAAVACGGLATIWLEVSPWIVAPTLLVLLALYYFVLPVLALRGLPDLDEKIGRLLQSAEHEKAEALWRGALMLRLFAPPGVMKQRLGQILSARRSWKAAFQAYHEAVDHVRPADRFPVMLGYAESGFHVGEDDLVRPVMERLARDPRVVGMVPFMLVHLAVAGGEKGDPEPRKLLSAWKTRARSERDRALLDLATAEVMAFEGKRKKALEKVRATEVGHLPENVRALATLLEAKLLHVGKSEKEAADLFEEVEKNPAGGRALLEMREFLD